MIGLLLARHHPTVSVIGIELQPALARHAGENARANALDGRCRVICGDLRTAPRYLPPEHFHRVVANPPFRKPGTGAAPPDQARAGGRHEFTFSLGDLARTAAALLRYGGSLDLIHLAERLPDLFRALDGAGLEPKILRHLAPFPGTPPHRVLLSAVKGGRPGLQTLPLLVLHERRERFHDGEAAALGTAPPPMASTGKKRQTDN